MSASELVHLELLTEVDSLLKRLAHWAAEPSPWESVQSCRALVERLLTRLEPLRVRLESPLVVATFGGTGTGKSSLVNALVGEELTPAGRQRPTTTEPVLLIHPDTRLETYGLPIHELRVVRCEIPFLREVILLDCPDPDTSDAETPQSNLARLHRLLPFCDVLIYVTTQQKYRSARVGEELAEAAAGCRLVFVQTHADRDSDIRDDWRTQLLPAYRVADMFFVDSRVALTEQQQGLRPSGDFGRLLDVLAQELSSSQRVSIRRANLLGLVDAALRHCRDKLAEQGASVARLATELTRQRDHLVQTMALQLQTELESSQGLWERRLLDRLLTRWSLSPFSFLLRVYHQPASWLSSLAMLRARSSAQLALLGLWQGAQWVQRQADSLSGAAPANALKGLGWGDAEFRETQLIIDGYARDAGLAPELRSRLSRESAADASRQVEDEFLQLVSRRIDVSLEVAAQRHSRWDVRLWYEVLWSLLPTFLLWLVAKNFFYDALLFNRPYLDLRFYLPAIVFTILWSGLFLMAFTGRLRRSLRRDVATITTDLAGSRAGARLFPALEAACRDFERDSEVLDGLAANVDTIRARHSQWGALGGRRGG